VSGAIAFASAARGADLYSLRVKSISLLKIAEIGAAASLTAWIALSIVRG